MANPVVVQSSVVAMTAASATVAPTLTGVVAGNALALAVFDTSRTSGYAATGVAGGGATWYRASVEPCATGVVEWWYGVGGTGGSITVTATMTGSDTAGAWLAEVSGVSIQPAVDTNVLATIATGSSVTPSLTPIPTLLGELILVASLAPSTETASPASPYTTYAGPLTAGAQRCGVASLVNATLTGNAAAWTCTTGVWAVAALALKPLQPWGNQIENAVGAQNNAGVLNTQAAPDYVDSIIAADAALGYGVLAGCEVAPNTGTDLKFQVGVGTVLNAWAPAAVAATTAVAITAADATNPRRDLVYVNYAGTISYVAGVAGATPCLPTLPSNVVALAFIDVPANATQLDATTSTSTAHVIDKRVMLGFPQSLQDYYSKATGVGFETFPRSRVTGAITITTANTYLCSIFLPAGFVVGHLAFYSHVGSSTLSHYYFGLCDVNRNQLAVTGDQLTATWANNTLLSLAIATTAQGTQSSFVTTYTGVYYVFIMAAATTPPTMPGVALLTNVESASAAPAIMMLDNTVQTTPPAFPIRYVGNNPVQGYLNAQVNV